MQIVKKIKTKGVNKNVVKNIRHKEFVDVCLIKKCKMKDIN